MRGDREPGPPGMGAQELGRWLVAYFGVFLAVAIACRWPALASPWWRQDDFLVRLQSFGEATTAAYYLRIGRPVAFLYHALFQPAYSVPAAAVVLRILGLSFQAATAAIVSACLAERSRRPVGSGVVGLLWITWPLASESTIWLDGTVVSAAGLLSTASALAVIRSEKATALVLGGLGIAAAVLLYPIGGLCGLSVVVCIAAWDVLLGRSLFPYFSRRGLALLISYASGFAAAFVLTRLFALSGPRARFTPSVTSSLLYVSDLLWNVVTSYGRSPLLLWVALVVAPSAVLLAAGLLRHPRSPETVRRTVLALGVLSLNLVLPFAPALAVSERWPSPRVAYAGPLAVLGLAGLAVVAARGSRLIWLGVAAFGGFALSSAHASWTDAADYVKLYRADIKLLRQIEEFASQRSADSVCVAGEQTADPNPYGLRFAILDHQRSDFLVAWQTEWLVRANSWLRYERRPEAELQCEAIANQERQGDVVRLYLLPGLQAVCVALPRHPSTPSGSSTGSST